MRPSPNKPLSLLLLATPGASTSRTGCSPTPKPRLPFRQQAPAASVDKVGRRPYTDRWYYRVFQSAPDLIRSLLPGSAAAANALGLDPGAPGDRLYRFQALEIKELSHRLDGVLWPREAAWRRRPTAFCSATSLGQPSYRDTCGCFWRRCTGSAWRS